MVNALVLCAVVFNMYNSLQAMTQQFLKERAASSSNSLLSQARVRTSFEERRRMEVASSTNSLSSIPGSPSESAQIMTPLTPLGVLDSSTSSKSPGRYTPLCQRMPATFEDFCIAIRDGNLQYVRNNMEGDYIRRTVFLNNNRYPIIIYALIFGQGGIFKMMLDGEFHGDANELVDSHQMSLSMYAYRYALKGKRYFVGELFKKDLFSQEVPTDENGRNALWHVITLHREQDRLPNDENFLKKIQVLIDFGVNPQIPDNEGITVLDEAINIYGEHSKVVQILKREIRMFAFQGVDEIMGSCAV